MSFLEDSSLPMSIKCEPCERHRDKHPCHECIRETYTAIAYMIWRVQMETLPGRPARYERFKDGAIKPYFGTDDWLSIMDRCNSEHLEHPLFQCSDPFCCNECNQLFWALILEYGSRIHNMEDMRKGEHVLFTCHDEKCDTCVESFVEGCLSNFSLCRNDNLIGEKSPGGATAQLKNVSCQTDDARTRTIQWLRDEAEERPKETSPTSDIVCHFCNPGMKCRGIHVMYGTTVDSSAGLRVDPNTAAYSSSSEAVSEASPRSKETD